MHSDLKLGLVLVPAAALLEAARPDGIALYVAREQLSLGAGAFGLLFTAGGIGGLAVIAAAIRVDRYLPNTMMAAGAVIGAFGIAVVMISNSFAVLALGMFVAGVGHSTVGSLIFYAVAVKCASRYRGTLIGALGMVYTMRLVSNNFYEWPFESPMLVIAISSALALAGAALLFRQLPRALGSYHQPGRTLSETLSAPGVSPECRLGGRNVRSRLDRHSGSMARFTKLHDVDRYRLFRVTTSDRENLHRCWRAALGYRRRLLPVSPTVSCCGTPAVARNRSSLVAQ